MKQFGLCVILLFISIGVTAGCAEAGTYKQTALEPSGPLQPAEHFIYHKLMNGEGMIKTNVSGDPLYLSESLGLWMEFLLGRKDEEHFQAHYRLLIDSFLTKNGLVAWKIEQNKASGTNALIDDFRIMVSLNHAASLWGNSEYGQTARKIGASLKKYNTNGGYFTDYYDAASGSASKAVTLSYVHPEALQFLKEKGIIDEKTEEQNLDVLYLAPLQNGFLPKSYNTETKQYKYDSEVNVIDQLYAAVNLKQGDDKAAVLSKWITQEFKSNGKLYGRYSAETKEPSVPYESPSVYALAVLFLLEQKEDPAVIKSFYERMTSFETLDPLKPDYGGYMSGGDTHSFDNLLPLLAERKLFNENIIQ
ncbi:lipoprotein YdaJ [Bacillus nakamurai]|uniref:lipoprotein YdaJ n=1 Tax=Bacillus nakamurai TaxID=1793963 RepID=UPI0020C20E08|nr:lipoprotein YdaJ [Bacillus nakamurai]MCP6683288.1 lipoprotein YdaJ [Bacillus nakamurai]